MNVFPTEKVLITPISSAYNQEIQQTILSYEMAVSAAYIFIGHFLLDIKCWKYLKVNYLDILNLSNKVKVS